MTNTITMVIMIGYSFPGNTATYSKTGRTSLPGVDEAVDEIEFH
jgi:hypothetical protein